MRSGVWSFLTSLLQRTGRDNLTIVAAGVAFYFMLAIFPGFAALVSVYGLFADPSHATDFLAQFGDLLPPTALKILTDGLNGFASKNVSELNLALVVSIVVALWSARAGISSLMTGLDIVYEETDQRSFIVQTIVSVVLTLAALVFALILILSVAIVPAMLSIIHFPPQLEALISIGRWPVLAVLVALTLAIVYRFAPYRSHPHWRWITWGSATATVLWLVGSALFSLYVTYFGNFDATYGSLGAVVILLLWFWVTALFILFGAEVDAELDARQSNNRSERESSAAQPIAAGRALGTGT